MTYPSDREALVIAVARAIEAADSGDYNYGDLAEAAIEAIDALRGES